MVRRIDCAFGSDIVIHADMGSVFGVGTCTYCNLIPTTRNEVSFCRLDEGICFTIL